MVINNYSHCPRSQNIKDQVKVFLFDQVSRLEGQLAALKDVSDGHYKRAEDLNNKLKQVMNLLYMIKKTEAGNDESTLLIN